MEQSTEMVFLAIDAAQPADARTCENGLFHSLGAFPGPQLITSDDHGRYIVHLSSEHAFRFGMLRGLRSRSKGLLVREPLIEFDISTAFDPDRGDGALLGDLILEGTSASVVAVEAGQAFADPLRLPLWGAGQSSDVALGFRSWRLVSGRGVDRHVLWSRVPAP
jgi:hypothetical protein